MPENQNHLYDWLSRNPDINGYSPIPDDERLVPPEVKVCVHLNKHQIYIVREDCTRTVVRSTHPTNESF